jgi:hypothetical protein
MSEHDKLNHWDAFIMKLIPELQESIRLGEHMSVNILRPTLLPNEEVIFRLQYTHPRLGYRSEELILFRDGTWRYIPT